MAKKRKRKTKDVTVKVVLKGPVTVAAYTLTELFGSEEVTLTVPYDCEDSPTVNHNLALGMGEVIETCTPSTAPDHGPPISPVWKSRKGSLVDNFVVSLCGVTVPGKIEDDEIIITKAVPC